MIIPQKLIQFWDNKDNIPPEYIEAITNNQKFIGDSEILFVDDKYMLNYLKDKDPFLHNLYSNIRIAAIRSDIARLVLLYKFGGLYLDMSVILKVPIEKLLSKKADVMLLRRDDQARYEKHPQSAHIGSMIIASAPNTEFIKDSLKYLVNSIISGSYNHHVLFATTKCINETYNLYLNRKDIEETNFEMMSFKALKKDFLTHLRVKGLANSWSYLEKDGIIEPKILAEIQKEYVLR